MKRVILCVGEEDNERLDAFLATKLNDMSRTYIQSLIKGGAIFVNGQQKKAKYLVKEGDSINIEIPKKKELQILAENIPLEIVYEDKDIAVINKSNDMVVHPAPGNHTGTLVNALLYHIDNLSSINGIIRPGIVHRLDKETSGVLVVAKSNLAHRSLSEQFKTREVLREYIALVEGTVQRDDGIIDAPIGRNIRDRKMMAVTKTNCKEAITRFKVLQRFQKYTLLVLQLETGRTHQIRVHLSYINHPIVGDPLYGRNSNEFNIRGQLLHARKIGFRHPLSNKYLEFETTIPTRFAEIIKKIGI